MRNNNNERSGNSSSSSKKGKNKSSSSSANNNNNINNNNNNNNNNEIENQEKPRQPQRGLGVAQLEKIRMHTQMANYGLLPPHPYLNPNFQHIPDDIRYHLFHQGVPSLPLLPPPQQQPAAAQPYGYSAPSVPPSAYGYQQPNASVPPSAYGYQHPNAYMMGMGDHMDRTGNNIGYNESQMCNTARWNPNNNIRVPPQERQPYLEPQSMITRHLISQFEQSNRKNESLDLNSGKNLELGEKEELDLELKL